MFLIFISMFAYGVATQALMYPNQQGSFGQVLGNIFFPSFFMMVGNDFSLDQLITCKSRPSKLSFILRIIVFCILIEVGQCDYSDERDTTYQYVNDYNGQNSTCPDVTGSKWAMVIHISYLVTLVVLLLNLLIAILK